MKIRQLKLTPQNLIQLLQGKTPPMANIPADAELVDLKIDLTNNQVQAIITSQSFSEVETYPIPELNEATTEAKVAAKPVATVRAEQKPEPKPITPVPTVTAKASIKMENEFSPEQRKVLSFTAKGDVVVVKPIQFLKEEWDDINEVVRSLGGKWVRGDIISYWEIPLQQS